MKKILFITPFPPSNIGAGVNYTRQLLDDMADKFKVDLIYFRNAKEKYYEDISGNINIRYIFTTSKLRKLISVICIPFVFPLFSAKFSFKKLNKIRKLLQKEHYDYVYIDFSQMFLYGKFIKGVEKIYMAHDIIGQRYERKNALAGAWAKLSEKWILKGIDNIFTFSNKDSSLLKKWYDLDSSPTPFYFEKKVEAARPEEIVDYYVFFAMWKRADNHDGLRWFIANVLPSLKNKKFKIIGAGLPEEIKNMIIKYNNVEYLGFVENPYPIIANSRALISPLFQGAGVKVKVLDALAVGTPIIGTEVSFEGIDDRYVDLMINANTVEDFVEKINNVNIPMVNRLFLKEQFLERNKNKAIIEFLQS